MERWSTLDRIVSVEAGREAVALRNIPSTLAILDTHFPRFPVVPGVLILGSLAALGGVLLESGGDRQWRLELVEAARFRHYARPGDQLELRVQAVEIDQDRAVLSGAVTVGGRTITTVRRLQFVPR